MKFILLSNLRWKNLYTNEKILLIVSFLVQLVMGNKKLKVQFYVTAVGIEPVREWLKDLGQVDKKTIGEDIKTIQFGWPLGMPLVGFLGDGLWEVRSKLFNNRISRVIFIIENGIMILLHGFIKKQQKTPKQDLDLARLRLKQLKG